MDGPLSMPTMQDNNRPFSAAAAQIVRKLQFSSDAFSRYEWSSGGLMWSDEVCDEIRTVPGPELLWVLVELWAFRASLIRGTAREEFRAVWDALAENYPNCPILRPERRSPELASLLDRGVKDMRKEMRAMERLSGDRGATPSC